MNFARSWGSKSNTDVDRYYREEWIREIADYCESDVLNTFRVWLRYELFRGGLSYEGFRKSENNLMQFVTMRGNTKPHLTELANAVSRTRKMTI